jgi:(2S)-methylsuccinyl-CoA dehydrogenase
VPADLQAARRAVDALSETVQRAMKTLAAYSTDEGGGVSVDLLERHEIFAYDLAHAASAVEACRNLLTYAELGEFEATLACHFIADAGWDLGAKILGRESEWGVDSISMELARPLIVEHRAPAAVAAFGDLVLEHGGGPSHLPDDFRLVADTFRRFADDKIRPVAEHVHRTNSDVPEGIINGLAELGSFGLSVPEEYGGYSPGGESEYVGMVVATEELSRASLGIGGSLITRPEILTRAIVKGGTEEQKQRWLPRIATGDLMVGVMVTEPDVGSDSALVSVSATKAEGGWKIRGVKTWATFAGRANALMLLARTDPDRSRRHRGLSLFVVDKPEAPGHEFRFQQDRGGTMEGRAIDTIGYRGMHSYEVAFDDWFVPDENLVGGQDGIGKGFYLTMGGFENGRLQTAGRALGVMQAAFEAAREYAIDRSMYGRDETTVMPLAQFQLTKAKLARMAALIQAGRQFAYAVARKMSSGEGTLEAAMVKAYVCRAAEWVTREAQQIHGGMGYAEEYPVSRYFVDARVLSIFEGADETLCLKVIARRLVDLARS